MYGWVDGKGRKIVLLMFVVFGFGFYEEDCVEEWFFNEVNGYCWYN